MAAQEKKELKINLLPQEEFAQSTLGRVLKWLTSSFRIIVIATEMVVMAAFLSRFWLDARISDLTDAINQKKAVITSYSQVEKDFREAQKELDIFSALAYDKSKYIPLLTTLTKQLPSDVAITSLAINSDDIQIKATTSSETSASNFLVNLKQTNLFDKINLTQTTTDVANNVINFQLTATFKKEGAQNGT